ncbi:hypothetical protein FB45DRAFT_885415, partial [Roridomyces roridus]
MGMAPIGYKRPPRSSRDPRALSLLPPSSTPSRGGHPLPRYARISSGARSNARSRSLALGRCLHASCRPSPLAHGPTRPGDATLDIVGVSVRTHRHLCGRYSDVDPHIPSMIGPGHTLRCASFFIVVFVFVFVAHAWTHMSRCPSQHPSVIV